MLFYQLLISFFSETAVWVPLPFVVPPNINEKGKDFHSFVKIKLAKGLIWASCSSHFLFNSDFWKVMYSLDIMIQNLFRLLYLIMICCHSLHQFIPKISYIQSIFVEKYIQTLSGGKIKQNPFLCVWMGS